MNVFPLLRKEQVQSVRRSDVVTGLTDQKQNNQPYDLQHWRPVPIPSAPHGTSAVAASASVAPAVAVDAMQQTLFLNFFLPSATLTVEQAWKNILFVKQKTSAWQHFVTEETLTAWFALTLTHPDRTYELLDFVYRHFLTLLLQSQLFVPALGLSAAELTIQAKLAIKQVRAHRQDHPLWQTFLNLHPALLAPLYQHHLDELQLFVSRLALEKVITFWDYHYDNLPQYATLIVASKIVEQQGVPGLFSRRAFQSSAQLQQANPWTRLQQDIIDLLQASRQLPAWLHDCLRTVLAERSIVSLIDMDVIDKDIFITYLCEPTRVQAWDATLAQHLHLSEIVLAQTRFKQLALAYFPQVLMTYQQQLQVVSSKQT